MRVLLHSVYLRMFGTFLFPDTVFSNFQSGEVSASVVLSTLSSLWWHYNQSGTDCLIPALPKRLTLLGSRSEKGGSNLPVCTTWQGQQAVSSNQPCCVAGQHETPNSFTLATTPFLKKIYVMPAHTSASGLLPVAAILWPLSRVNRGLGIL